MCGIVGFLDKRGGTERPIGKTLLAMLQALSCRGPDSAGVAVFGLQHPNWVARVVLAGETGPRSKNRLALNKLGGHGHLVHHDVEGAYVRLEIQNFQTAVDVEKWVDEQFPGAEVVSLGRRLEIVKQVGSPAQLEQTYGISKWVGSHGIGHTRLSTESKVDLSHSQPFGAHGVPDLATVHNGHITNYHKLRRQYEQRGYRFYTENDSEIIGVYLRDRMAKGMSLTDALRSSLDDFDGSFSYLAASADGLAYVKDRFGFKPLMVLETDEYVAIATEEIALEQVLGPDFAALAAEEMGMALPERGSGAREPAPGTMAVWQVSTEQVRA